MFSSKLSVFWPGGSELMYWSYVTISSFLPAVGKRYESPKILGSLTYIFQKLTAACISLFKREIAPYLEPTDCIICFSDGSRSIVSLYHLNCIMYHQLFVLLKFDLVSSTICIFVPPNLI